MTLAQAFAERLKQERRRKAFEEDRDISWEDVAQAVGLSGAAISRYVQGRLIPDDPIVQRLADYFGVRRVWLREGEGEKVPSLPPSAQTHSGQPRGVGEKVADPAPKPREVGRTTARRRGAG